MEQSSELTEKQALDSIELLIERIVIHENELSEFRKILNDARMRNTVPIRGIQEKLISYRECHKLYTPFTNQERKVLHEAMELWG